MAIRATAVGLLLGASVFVAVAPSGAKGGPYTVAAPATGTAGDVVTVRVTMVLRAPADGPQTTSDQLALRRVTSSKPYMWKGTAITRVTLVHQHGNVFEGRVELPDIPGRYLFYPAPNVVRNHPTDLKPVAPITIKARGRRSQPTEPSSV